MGRKISPLFAVVVILFAVAIGFLSFMFRLRAYDAAEKREAQMLQAQADAQRLAAMRNGTYGAMQGGPRRGGRRAATNGKAGAAPGTAPKAAGADAKKADVPAPAEPESAPKKPEAKSPK